MHQKTWRLFQKGAAQLTERIEQELEQAGLPALCWYDVLSILETEPKHKKRLHELAEELVCQRSNLTRLIDRMEVAGLVCRQSCSQDGRGVFAKITEAGLIMRQKMQPIYEQAVAHYFGQHLSEVEITVLTKVFQRLLIQANAASIEQCNDFSY